MAAYSYTCVHGETGTLGQWRSVDRKVIFVGTDSLENKKISPDLCFLVAVLTGNVTGIQMETDHTVYPASFAVLINSRIPSSSKRALTTAHLSRHTHQASGCLFVVRAVPA